MPDRINPSDVVDDAGELGGADAGAGADGPIGAEAGPTSGRRSIVDVLLTTERPEGETPGSIESDYRLSKGRALILFGFVQMAGTGGIPAIGNVLLGTLLEARDAGDAGDDRDDAGQEVTVVDDVVDGGER